MSQDETSWLDSTFSTKNIVLHNSAGILTEFRIHITMCLKSDTEFLVNICIKGNKIHNRQGLTFEILNVLSNDAPI